MSMKMMLNKTRTSTLGAVHHNLEEIDCPPETSNSTKFSIYDLKSVKKDILTIFDAAQYGDAKAIMRFSKVKHFDVDAKDRSGRTALIWACDCAHLPCVETLIRLSANINTKDTHAGRTAIHWAARAGNLPIVNNYGLTPLYLAKSKGHEGEAVFRYLLGEGAPYNDIKTIDIKKVEAEIARKMAKLAEENGESSE
ncbi:hypothetical protein KC19_9G160900 [Ceratodon purpureus]|uniref:Ankyrin repeat domain-containing protein n=1 Tax=Ceratodon purpureus TaxID=3225 RepID=A0A8T0GY04_CERPU|nr:hypothetical protein KC19_9G160900 [Ceratodon purpureus]